MLSPDRNHGLPCEPPTDSALRACHRRDILITPDRRSFIQSMHQEAARRVTGNAVPAHATDRVFAYTFPAQYCAQMPHAIPSTSRYHTMPPAPQSQSTPSRRGDDMHGSRFASPAELAMMTPTHQDSARGKQHQYTDVDSSRRRTASGGSAYK